MTMLRLTRRRREVLVDKVPDTANVALAALVFGQFLGERPYSLAVGLVGLAIWSALIVITMLVTEDRG